MENDESMKSKVDEMTSINFSITKCPQKVFRKFTDFCKKETNNNYSFGLKMLLDGMDGNIKEALLFEQYIELKSRMDDLEIKFKELTDKPPKKVMPKTMGSSNK